MPSASGSRPSPTAAGAAARGAAGVLGGIEGIARRPEQVVVAGATKAHHRAVGLAQEDGAGLLDPLGEGAVEIRHEVLERAHAAEGARPARLEVEQILDRRRHAVQRAERRARHQRLLGRPRSLAGIVEAEIDESVEARVARLDPRDEGVHDLDRRQVAPADAQRQLGCAHEGQLVRQRHVLSSDFFVGGTTPRHPASAASDRATNPPLPESIGRVLAAKRQSFPPATRRQATTSVREEATALIWTAARVFLRGLWRRWSLASCRRGTMTPRAPTSRRGPPAPSALRRRLQGGRDRSGSARACPATMSGQSAARAYPPAECRRPA